MVKKGSICYLTKKKRGTDRETRYLIPYMSLKKLYYRRTPVKTLPSIWFSSFVLWFSIGVQRFYMNDHSPFIKSIEMKHGLGPGQYPRILFPSYFFWKEIYEELRKGISEYVCLDGHGYDETLNLHVSIKFYKSTSFFYYRLDLFFPVGSITRCIKYTT